MSDIQRIKQQRIKLTVTCFAYECCNDSLVSDFYWDELAQKVEATKHVATGDERYDKFFREHFDPNTGMWIRKHPDLLNNSDKLDKLYGYYLRLKAQ